MKRRDKWEWNLRPALRKNPPTVWIDLASQLQRIRGGQVRVGRGHGEDEGVWIGDEGQDHLLYLSLDVLWLVANRDLKQQHHGERCTKKHANGILRSLPLFRTSGINQEQLPLSLCIFGLWAKSTFVMPGKSTSVRFRTLGEKIFRCIGSGLIPWWEGKKR